MVRIGTPFGIARPMTQIADICRFLDRFAPLALAEEWDNVGLLLGDATASASRVLTCLTVTPASADEAIQREADLIVSHHPMPFRPVKKITTDSTVGGMLWKLARAGVSIYSPHTAFDSATAGINQRLAEGIKLKEIAPLRLLPESSDQGSGRFGTLTSPEPLTEVAEQLKAFLNVEHLHAIGPLDREIRQVAVACGSAGEFLADAARLDCDLLITGETSFHTCLDVEARNMCMLLTGHFPSERFAVERLAEVIGAEFSDLTVWASEQEADPVKWI